jgi:membrane fusion protein (multidrug efflux system)
MLSMLFLSIITYVYYGYERHYPSTHDAYVDGQITEVTSQVAGIVDKIFVKDNQYVKKGKLLLSLDKRYFKILVRQAEAELTLEKQKIEGQVKEIAAETAKLQSLLITEAQLKKDMSRNTSLIKTNAVSEKILDDSQYAYKSAVSKVHAQNLVLEELRAQLGEKGDDNANLKAAQALLDKANWDLANADVYSPLSGFVSNLSLNIGNPVQALQVLFGIVPEKNLYISANYLEFFMEYIRPGQTVKIKLSLYPDTVFKGRVDSISYGVARNQEKSLTTLAYVAPSLNWIVLARRFPIRIQFIDKPKNLPLRVGANAQVSINTGEYVTKH